MLHLVARYDRDPVAVDLQPIEKEARRFHPPARCNRPRDFGMS